MTIAPERTSPTFFLPKGVGAIAADVFDPPPNPYKHDPVIWMHDKVGRHLWSKQVEILESVRDHRKTAVRSCHGPGKSFTGSGTVGWWLDDIVHNLGSAFAITTAPSWPQVQSILWREIRKRYREGSLRGRITLDCQWYMGDFGTKRADSSEELIGMGRKPADYDDDTFQGIHARFLLALLDEACGIPESLWNSVLSLVTNENCRVLALGNPDDPNTKFAKICAPGSDWNVIGISVYDTPNFTGDDKCAVCGEYLGDDVMESLVSQLWVDEARKEWGEGSPMWQSKVLGVFPDVSDEYLISPTLIELCRQNSLVGLETGRYGLDIARYGTDKSCLYRNRGGVIREVDTWSKADTMSSVGRAIRAFRRTPHVQVPTVVDIIGVGAGVYDRLREQRYNVAPYQGSQRAVNPAKFKNRRSESWWNFMEMMTEGLIDLDPKDDILAAQLGSIKWDTDSAGRIYVETKEDMRDRGMPSPDHADAAVLSTCNAGTAYDVRSSAFGHGRSLAGDLLKKRM